MSKIKYLFRDFRGVIIKINLKQYAHTVIIAKLYNLTTDELWEHIEKPFDLFRRGEINEQNFWKILSKSIGVPVPSGAKKIFHIDPSSYASPNKSIINFINRMKNLGYISILLSDVLPPLKVNTHKLGWYSYFEDLVFSCDVGLSKFDDVRNGTTKIFEHTLKRYKIRGNEAVFIDDSKRNCLVAEKLGIKTVVADKSSQVIRDVKKILKI